MKRIYSLLFTLVTAASVASAQTIVSFSDIDRIQTPDGGSTWNIDSATNSLLLSGVSGTSTNGFETAVIFDISAQDAAIAAAPSISFNIAYDAILGAGQDITLYTFGTNTATVAGIGAATFHSNGVNGSDAGSILAGDFSAPGIATYDITTIAQGLIAFDNIAFLLFSGDLIGKSGAGPADAIQFYRQNTIGSQPNGGAYLSIAAVPEPSAFALLSGCLALVVVMTRRRGKASA